MQLSNKKAYDVSEVLALIAPTVRAAVWFDENGVGEIKLEAGTLPTEAELDAAGNIETLKDAKSAKRKEVNAKRRAAELLPTFYNGSNYDPVFLLEIVGDVAMMDDIETKLIITEENTLEQLTKFDLKNRITHLRTTRITPLRVEGRRMKDEINALTDLTAVNNYTVTF